jgi:cysteine-rich repeat protein
MPDPTSGSADDTTTSPGTDGTDGGCPPGTIGCPCVDGTCDEGLGCIDDVCGSATCGNNMVEPPEACDDQNDKPDDGCENDCTVSPGAAEVATGGDHTCVVSFDGRVRCWGAGEDGRTGQGKTDDLGDTEVPSEGIDLPFPGPVQAIGLGDGFGCALLTNGSVMCWGRNANGRLGIGTDDAAVLDERGDVLTPVQLTIPAIALAVGRQHACVIHQGGAVRCWGAGGKGRLGYGEEPTMIGNDVGDDELADDLEEIQIGGQANALTAGVEHTCALLESGEVQCWGAYSEGRLGVPGLTEDIGDDEDPESIEALDLDDLKVQQIVADGHHTCAVVGDDPQLWCWGKGANGRLGTGDVADVIEPQSIETGGRTVAVDLGEAHTCVVLTEVTFRDDELDQVVRCFGEGAAGRLGNEMAVDLGGMRATLPELLPPIDVLGAENRRIQSIAAGVAHTCVRTSGGFVRCWGEAAEGRLGYGDLEDIGDNEPPSQPGDVMVE